MIAATQAPAASADGKSDEHRTRPLGLLQDPDRRLGNDPELPLRADGEAKQIVTFRVEVIAA